jgi:hypothetical protein
MDADVPGSGRIMARKTRMLPQERDTVNLNRQIEG